MSISSNLVPKRLSKVSCGQMSKRKKFTNIKILTVINQPLFWSILTFLTISQLGGHPVLNVCPTQLWFWFQKTRATPWTLQIVKNRTYKTIKLLPEAKTNKISTKGIIRHYKNSNSDTNKRNSKLANIKATQQESKPMHPKPPWHPPKGWNNSVYKNYQILHLIQKDLHNLVLRHMSCTIHKDICLVSRFWWNFWTRQDFYKL